MKSIASLLFFIVASMTVCAQSVSIGAAGIYGDDIEKSGIQLRAYYNFKGNRVCFGPEFSNFFIASETHNGETTEKKLKEFNFNLHYVFEITETFGFYPLIGVNFSSEKEDVISGSDVSSHTIDAFGTNLGIGVHKTKHRWVLFGEYDHLFSDLSQNSFILGAFYTIGKTHSEH